MKKGQCLSKGTGIRKFNILGSELFIHRNNLLEQVNKPYLDCCKEKNCLKGLFFFLKGLLKGLTEARGNLLKALPIKNI